MPLIGDAWTSRDQVLFLRSMEFEQNSVLGQGVERPLLRVVWLPRQWWPTVVSRT